MGPRYLTSATPVTESAQELRMQFYCDLCRKGYSRVTELEHHESSYEHTHNRRFMDLQKEKRAMNAKKSKPTTQTEMVPLNFPKSTQNANALPRLGSGSGWKPVGAVAPKQEKVEEQQQLDIQSAPIDPDDDFYGDYDFRHPTSCGEYCLEKPEP